MRNKIVIAAALVSLSCVSAYSLVAPQIASAQTEAGVNRADPTAVLNKVANDMLDGLRAHKATLKSDPNEVYSLANTILIPHADLDEMAKRVLPPAIWNSATPAQRVQFEREYTTLLIRTYSSALASYSDQVVKFYPVRGGYEGKTRVQVDSDILQSGGPKIPVSYKVIQRGSDWKVYDLIVDGISLQQSFRSQFADQLTQGDMASLLRNLSSHNAKLTPQQGN